MTKPLSKRINFYVPTLVATLGVAGYAFAPAEGNTVPTDPPKFAQAQHSEPLPRPRDPDIAVQEEFDAARALATIEAWELFLARHGDHRLAAQARKEREKIRQKNPR